MYEKATIFEVNPQLSIPEISLTSTPEEQNHAVEIVADKGHVNIAEAERGTCSTIRDIDGQDTDETSESESVNAGSTELSDTSGIGKDTYCEINDNKKIAEIKSVDVGLLEISKTSEISTTGKDMHGIHSEQSEKNAFFMKIEPSTLKEEKQILEVNEEKNTEYKEILQEDELIQNKANSLEIVSKTTKSVDCPYDVITETIEKNLESVGLNESSKEIRVQAT